MRKRRIVAICIFAMAVVLVSAICIHQVKNVKENEDENHLLGIEGIKEANVSIAMNGDDIERVTVDVKFDETVLSESEKENVENGIMEYIKPLYENAEITLNVLN